MKYHALIKLIKNLIIATKKEKLRAIFNKIMYIKTIYSILDIVFTQQPSNDKVTTHTVSDTTLTTLLNVAFTFKKYISSYSISLTKKCNSLYIATVSTVVLLIIFL